MPALLSRRFTRPAAIAITPWRGSAGQDRLEAWRANVGEPVAVDLAPEPVRTTVTELVVVSWNLWIGRGRLVDVVTPDSSLDR